MVVKKKNTYKKQKGGLVLPEKLTIYFDFITFMINCYNTYINETSKTTIYNTIVMMIREIKNACGINQENIYILNLSIELLRILFGYFKYISYKKIMESFVKKILSYIFINEIKIFSRENLIFVDHLMQIFINMLFNQYLLTQPNIVTHNIKLLLETFHLEFRDNHFLMNLIKNIFLTKYRISYSGVPVFYGNIYYSDTNNLQYNRFICEKVSITSNEKRNYIINPVGALIQPYLIDERLTLGQEIKNRLTELFQKILRYKFIPGNKIRTEFTGIPKLIHLNGPSKFCIALDRDGKEDIVQHSTLRMCSKLYGCALRMTPIIRDENIASNEDILELLSILLEIKLNMDISPNSYIHIQGTVIPSQRSEIQSSNNRRRNGSALSPIQEFGPARPLRQNPPKLSPVNVFSDEEKRNRGNFSLYNNISPEQLLKTKYYKTILDKLYKEAYKLIRKTTPYNRTDIQKRTKLLEIIRLLQINPETRLNINHNLVRNL